MRGFTPPLAEDIRAERLDEQTAYEEAVADLRRRGLIVDDEDTCPPDCWACAQEKAHG